MFQKTLSLSNNPFDPDDIPPRQNLGGEPLRVDEEPKLLDLFCWDLGGLLHSKQAIDRFLFGVPRPGEKPVPKPGIFVVAGGKGTGKTTLGSYIKRRVWEASPTNTWKEFWIDLPWLDDPTRPTIFVERMKGLREKLVGALGAQRENAFVFLDNIPAGGLSSVINVYQDFKAHNQIYVVTTSDPGLQQSELDWFVAARVKLIQTRNVNAAELQSYIAARVKRYRDPARNEFEKLSKTFPWASSAAERLIGTAPGADQPLRLLNRWLSEEVIKTHADREVDPTIDMHTLTEAALEKLLIL